jgi:uncharacterized protein YfaP (DUF2135 family)
MYQKQDPTKIRQYAYISRWTHVLEIGEFRSSREKSQLKMIQTHGIKKVNAVNEKRE